MPREHVEEEGRERKEKMGGSKSEREGERARR